MSLCQVTTGASRSRLVTVVVNCHGSQQCAATGVEQQQHYCDTVVFCLSAATRHQQHVAQCPLYTALRTGLLACRLLATRLVVNSYTSLLLLDSLELLDDVIDDDDVIL